MGCDFAIAKRCCVRHRAERSSAQAVAKAEPPAALSATEENGETEEEAVTYPTTAYFSSNGQISPGCVYCLSETRGKRILLPPFPCACPYSTLSRYLVEQVVTALGMSVQPQKEGNVSYPSLHCVPVHARPRCRIS